MAVQQPVVPSEPFALFDASDRPLPSSAPLGAAPADDPSEAQRILIIDDNRAIHDDFRKVLVPADEGSSALSALTTELFGTEETPARCGRFELTSAFQGREGFEIVKRSVETGQRFAVAFVDMRMPPGWDGLETIEQIWNVDPDLQI